MIIDFLELEVTDLAEDIKDKHIQLGQKATGDWEKSVSVEREEYSVSIWALDYAEYLVNGRAPGGMPPIDPLKRWVQAKLGVGGKEGESIAWAVAKKIEKEGTNIYPEGTDLIDGVLTEARFLEIQEKIGQEMNLLIQQDLVRQFKEAFA